jgi:hypothetical protein
MTDLVSSDVDIRQQKTPGDREIGDLAERQHRVVAHRQLIALGFGLGAIQHRLKNGSLYQLYRGVYAVGCRSVSLRGRIMAAVLACGPGAVASHQTAALLHGLRPSSRSVVDVTVPGRTRRGRRGIAVHAVRAFHPEDRAIVDGVPVTSVARTLLDLAEVLRPRQLGRVVEEAEKLRLFDLGAVDRVCARSRGRRGLKPLAHAIAAYREPPITQSELERIFVEVCDAAGIARPEMNVIVAGRVVDAVWHEPRLVVELDSRTHHLTTAAFEEDRRRDADLMLAGYRVLRITWRRLTEEPAAVVELLRRLLSGG